uniref:EF-hand domain-containing protein n=1 Tax=Panagrellus redivivus TaxID=6233 RepID=A0A7E4V4I2_PANRE
MYKLVGRLMLVGCVGIALGQRPTIAPKGIVDITPIPMENLNPRLTEFRRIDANSDNFVTFTEFLLGDRPYLEAQSRNFHNLDSNADGRVSRDEFEAFYKEQDDSRNRIHTDGFFKQLSLKASQTGTGPIIVNLSSSNDTKIPELFLKTFKLQN